MSAAPVPCRSLRFTLAATLALLAGACDGSRRGTQNPGAELLAAGWIDAEPIGAATLDDPDRLALLEQAGVRGRLLRLDRLLDLYDGARFGADPSARESLWLALGGYVTREGIDASREVVLRLLDEAYTIEDLAAAQPDALSEDQQRFVADAIMLLSADMFLPDSAEALISQTLGYRIVAESGHPRVADNARWRLYDHVRGVLVGATEVGPQLRADIVVQALYAEREDVSAWLEDLAPHAQPPLPSATELWALLDQQRAAIEAIPRWRPVLAARTREEAELRETVTDLLPRPRDPAWALVELPRGTGQRESLAPVVLLAHHARVLEPTSTTPIEQAGDAITDEQVAALEGLLARDGRGTVLLAAAPETPAPELAAALALLTGARVSTIELAVHEPRLDGEGAVVVALPLYVARQTDLGPGARALLDARIHVQLSGRGPRFRIDGRWLNAAPTLPSDVQQLVASLQRAYPSEPVISVALAPDVQPGQLVDLLAILTGGIAPNFEAAGWLPDAAIVTNPAGDAGAEPRLLARTTLLAQGWAFTLPGSVALSDDDRSRVTQAAASLRDCVPELEVALPNPVGTPKPALTLTLALPDAKLTELRASGRRIDAAALERLRTCAHDRLVGFRLRADDGPTELTLELRVPADPTPEP